VAAGVVPGAPSLGLPVFLHPTTNKTSADTQTVETRCFVINVYPIAAKTASAKAFVPLVPCTSRVKVFASV
jgi:hypothetical protein